MAKNPKCLAILAQLPDEFQASDYKKLSGIKYSSAAGFISHLTKSGHIERVAYGRYRKLNGTDSPPPVAPANTAPPLTPDLSAVSSLFDDIAAILAENNRLREENSELRNANAKLREESTWLTAEINRWAQIARVAKQIPVGRTACKH